MRLGSLHAQGNSRRSGGLEVVCPKASLSFVLSFVSRCLHTVVACLHLHIKSQYKRCFLLSSVVRIKSLDSSLSLSLHFALTAKVNSQPRLPPPKRR